MHPFTLGIPLIARTVARDWPLVERLLAATLRSVLAQDDPAFRVLLATHDRPGCWDLVAADLRFAILPAHWTPAPPTAANDDGGAKKAMLKDAVRADGGGLLLFLDADDWLDRRTVGEARRRITGDAVGGYIAHGLAVDAPTARALPMPVPGFFGRFHQLCGSSVIGRYDPAGSDRVAHDPHAALGSHTGWPEAAAAAGHRLVPLDLTGAYVLGTGDSHSERDGPFAAWRRDYSAAVRRLGRPLTPGELARFGQDG